MLVYHGRSKDICEWVIEQYKNNPLCKDNLTTQSWIKQCEEYLQLLKEADARNNL